jgi:hypothetical protein
MQSLHFIVHRLRWVPYFLIAEERRIRVNLAGQLFSGQLHDSDTGGVMGRPVHWAYDRVSDPQRNGPGRTATDEIVAQADAFSRVEPAWISRCKITAKGNQPQHTVPCPQYLDRDLSLAPRN